jgi:hypothetical protein
MKQRSTRQRGIRTEGGLRRVPAEPDSLFAGVLRSGPDGQCAYYYPGIQQRCPNDSAAYFPGRFDGESVRIELCGDHAEEFTPEPLQESEATDE